MATIIGVVHKWSWKGHGFIFVQPDKTYFLHYSFVKQGRVRLGSVVEFEIGSDMNAGRERAECVRVIAQPILDGITQLPMCPCCKQPFREREQYFAGENTEGRAYKQQAVARFNNERGQKENGSERTSSTAS